MDKSKILSATIDEQLKVIENLKISIERYKHESDLDKYQTLDPEDYARQSEAKDMQLRFEKMLKSAILNLKIIEDARSPIINQEIRPGALLETDKNYIFVGVSVSGFKFDGKDVISISEEAPVFKNLKSKRIGDKVEIGNNIFEIKNII